MQMTDPEILRYVLEHMEQYPDPTIRKALVDKGIDLERVEKAMDEAKRMAKQARETGQPINLGTPQPGLPGWVWIGLSLLAVGAAGLVLLALRRPG
ncbi:MAG: hypothetical protein WC728_11455 [Elusimicrobiota bacterium]